MLVLVAIVSPPSAAQPTDKSPVRCKMERFNINYGGPPIWSLNVYCDVLEDNSTINGITLNRGRCEPINVAGVGKTLQFGERFQFQTGLCNLLEYQVTVNGRPWTFRMD